MENHEQKYKESLEKLRAFHRDYKNISHLVDVKEELESIFPELRESEDEKIRKEIISFITDRKNWFPKEETKSSWIAWLEKQGEQDNNEDSNILQRFSFYSYKDEPNILYLSGLYVNEECRNKGIGTKILEVADEVAKSLNCHAIRLKTKKDSNAERLYRTHGYNSLPTEKRGEIWFEKQGEQKPVEWSKEDDEMLQRIISDCESKYVLLPNEVDWLKSLKPQNVWISVDEEVYVKEPVLAQKKDKSDLFWGFVVCCDHTLTPNVYERYMILGNIVSQNTWKPSEQNIKDLEWCADLVKDKMGVGFHRLQVFIDKLKNL